MTPASAGTIALPAAHRDASAEPPPHVDLPIGFDGIWIRTDAEFLATGDLEAVIRALKECG
jgi:hypothetical protein